MPEQDLPRVAVLYPGDAAARRAATAANNRFADLFLALAALGVQAEPAVWHDEIREEVRSQLLQADGVLVWVNPVHEGRDRTQLDALLREVSEAGVFVSAHPDVIVKMGTKEVLHRTRDLGWGCDTHLYADAQALRRELPARLAQGAARVLKQVRGHSGSGVWKVERASPDGGHGARLRLRHALRGSVEEIVTFEELLARMAPYFERGGRIVDQAWQARLPEGMTRCYLVHDRVEGFGHQAVNALHPPPPGAPPEAAPEPGPRLYHPATDARFQALRHRVEEDWVPALQRLLGIERHALPVIWDCDFLLGPRTASAEDTWVLCEINVSSVAPYPESAVAPMAAAARERATEARRARG